MLVFFVLIGLLVAPSEFIASHGLNGFTEALSEKDTNHIHACSMTLRPRSRFVEKSFPRSPPPIPGHRRRDITAAHRTCRKMPANRRSNASAPTISMSPHVFRSQDHAPDFQRLNPDRCRLAPSHQAPPQKRGNRIRWRIAFGLSWLWESRHGNSDGSADQMMFRREYIERKIVDLQRMLASTDDQLAIALLKLAIESFESERDSLEKQGATKDAKKRRC
jgi:hypothetical protein